MHIKIYTPRKVNMNSNLRWMNINTLVTMGPKWYGHNVTLILKLK